MFQECKKAHLSLWQCPPFLFVIMGAVTIVSMVATYVLASRQADEPQIAALIVIGVAAFIFVIGNIIINSFNRIAEANRLKSEFIYIISHQLRSPLAIFKWTLDMIEHRLGKNSAYESVENFLYTLRNSSEYMIRLADSLMEINRLESGEFMLKKEKFSLSILTKEILRVFSNYAEASNITLRFEGPMETPEVFADKERTTLVIHNLIDNAIRYTQGAGYIIIKIEPKDSFLVWSIKDEGIGIDPEKQKYLFQKFFRSDEARGVQTYGSGLGLYIAKQIVGLSGGQIDFQSEDGKGCVFWFSLPQAN